MADNNSSNYDYLLSDSYDLGNSISTEFGNIYGLGSGTGAEYLNSWGNLPGGDSVLDAKGLGDSNFQFLNPDKVNNYLAQNNLSIYEKQLPGNRTVNFLKGPNGILPETVTVKNWGGDGLFGLLVDLGVGAVTGGALGGGGFAGGLGVTNPAMAGALNSGLAGGMASGGSGGNFLEGFGQGAIGGGLGGAMNQLNPAGSLGIENKTLGSMFNKGVGNALGTYASTKDAGAALTSGLQGAATTGMNNMGNFFRDLFNGGDQYQEGSNSFMGAPSWLAGNELPGPPELLRGPPSDLAPNFMGPPADPFQNVLGQPTLQSFQRSNEPSLNFSGSGGLSGMGSRLGNFALNNAGDLASMLYGLYNNRRQQKAIGNQMSGLQDLYSQNSPYAQQLRSKLGAQAAAKGSRLNTSGRETQLQAMLADKAASMAPNIYQMQQGQNQLQNNQLDIVRQGLQRMGGFRALSDLFGGQ